MKFQDLLKDEIDSLADDHIGSSIDNPIRKDAFKVSDTEKIKLIQEKVHDILDILLTDGTGTEHGEASLHEENESSLFNWNVFVWGQDRFADWGEELE